MKTLIFSGSPRKNGDTMALVKEVIKYLNGEYKTYINILKGVK